MSKSNKFSPEVRERAVRMVQEHLRCVPASSSHACAVFVCSRWSTP